MTPEPQSNERHARQVEDLRKHAAALRAENEALRSIQNGYSQAIDALRTDLEHVEQSNLLLRAGRGVAQQAIDAIQERDALRKKLDQLPADWMEDSSLETWFPFTAKEVSALRQRVSELESLLAAKP